MNHSTIFIGLDTAKDFHDVAIAEEGRAGEVRHYGQIDSSLAALDKLVRKLSAPGRTLHFVYEAGPCGYTIYRHLTGKGLCCAVVAPSKTPRKSGDRVKTNRRDAISRARLERAGELTHVYVPCPEDEAMRDLVRARTDAVRAHTKARQQLAAFLLRCGIKYNSRTAWSPQHKRFIADISLPFPAQQIVFQEYVEAISDAEQMDDRAGQPLGGAQRQTVNFFQRRHAQDRGVSIEGWLAAFACARRVVPGRENRFGDPDGQASPVDKSFVILSPVAEAVSSLAASRSAFVEATSSVMLRDAKGVMEYAD